MSPCMLVFTSICFWQILPFHLVSVDASVLTDSTTLSDLDIKLQLNYITRRLYVLEEENVALRSENVHLNKRLSCIEEENEALKSENGHLNKRLSSLEDDNHELMKSVKLIKELSNTLKERTKTVVPVNKGLDNITSTLTDNQKSRGQRRMLVPAGSTNNLQSPVAFTAVLTHDVTLGPLQTLEYDKVITNIGNAYDRRDGRFTVPVNGIYMLSVTVFDLHQFLRTELVRNGVQLVAMFGDDDDSSSHTIMVSLEEDDMVWVRHFKEGISTVHGLSDRLYNSFTGALITALQ